MLRHTSGVYFITEHYISIVTLCLLLLLLEGNLKNNVLKPPAFVCHNQQDAKKNKINNFLIFRK